MTQGHTCLPKANAAEKNQRVQHLEQFFLIKQKVSFISRQTLYLGIAIFDKYWERVKKAGKDMNSSQPSLTLQRTLTCLWMAWKFNEVNAMPLKRVLSTFSITDVEIKNLVELEAQIIEKIDFQIPIEFTYLELTSCFQEKIKDKNSSVALVSQCLGFLKEGIMLSSDFSLCADLGKNILSLYTTRAIQDSRIKRVYAAIKQRKEKDSRKEIEG